MDTLKAKSILYKLAAGDEYTPAIQEQIKNLVEEDQKEGAKFHTGDYVYILDPRDLKIVRARVIAVTRVAPDTPFWYKLMEGTGRRLTDDYREDWLFRTASELVDTATRYFGNYLQAHED